MSGCFPTRNVPAGKYLLLNNDYKITEGKIKEHSISSYFLQKPNKRILFYRFYLNVYNFGKFFKDSSWVNRMLTENIGEPPVIFDSVLMEESGKRIKQHLNNLGYYNSEVYVKTTLWKTLKTAKVKYIIKAGKPYRIKNIDYDIEERDVRSFVIADLSNTLLKTGDIFRLETLKKERDRIVSNLNNEGYYYFIPNQITYLADTNLKTNEVNITLTIKPLKARKTKKDTVTYVRDRRYKIKDIYIIYNIAKQDLNKVRPDTLEVNITERKQYNYTYRFIYLSEMDMNPKALITAIFMKPGRYYKKNDAVETYKALTTLNTFRYINVELTEIPTPDTVNGELICRIYVMRNKKFSFTSNSELKNTGGDFGVEENLGLRSRNTFRNAEVFSINFHGAMEMQSVTNTPSQSNFPFNVFEAGINSSLTFPRFLNPLKNKKKEITRYYRPHTKITLGYNYQKRPDYTRYILNSSFRYSWQPIIKRIYEFKLLDISSVKIYPTPEFQDIINKYTDPRIKYSYQDHLILSSGYSYNYNEHRFKGLKPFSYLFAGFEIGGAPWNIFARLDPNARDSLGRITIFGLPSAEYLLLKADGRYYLPSGKDLMNVFRANIGIGIPYGTTKALPFEKSFYIGGANSLRAWVIGTLGPGAFNSKATTFEMTGDIKIEFNYELRFKISGSFEGAVFTDIGNIWLLNESDAMPGAQFKFSTFIPQFAADFGYGLRYDLEFLIIRIDFAHPIYQPYLPAESRWSALNPSGKLITGFNFAIGYPF